MYLGFFFCFRGELGFLNSDYICMCVLNKQFKLIEFVFNSVYVDIKYIVIYPTFTTGSVCLLLVFATTRSVVKSVKVPVVEVAKRTNRSHRIPP